MSAKKGKKTITAYSLYRQIENCNIQDIINFHLTPPQEPLASDPVPKLVQSVVPNESNNFRQLLINQTAKKLADILMNQICNSDQDVGTISYTQKHVQIPDTGFEPTSLKQLLLKDLIAKTTFSSNNTFSF